MLQAVMKEPGKIEYRVVPVQEIKSNQVKLKIKSIGVCGSDVHVNHGKHPYTSYPVVQGHEVSAEVMEVGEEVTNVRVGDKVTVQPQIVCGNCYQCTHGLYNGCEELKVMGFQATGMASEYFVVDSNKVLALPKEMTWEEGALIEPLAVAVHAVRRAGDIKGKKAVVLGGGPIGNLVAQTAKAMGARNVIVSELSEYRIEVAKKCGLQTIQAKNGKLDQSILSHFGNDKADFIFECVGSSVTIDQAIRCARKGSAIVVVGVFGELCNNINMGLVQDHELTLKGSAMYREEDYIKALELVESGLINLDILVTHHVDFKNFKEAYSLIDEQKDKIMKVIVDMK